MINYDLFQEDDRYYSKLRTTTALHFDWLGHGSKQTGRYTVCQW